MKTADVVEYFGTQEQVAAALGISQAAVSQWGDEVPPRRAYEIEQITGGKLKAPKIGRAA